jgi:hypothetical protein
MQCAYHPQIKATGSCRDCFKPLCADCAATGQCTVCAAQDAARDLQQDDRERAAGLEARAAKKKRLGRLRTAALWGLMALCITVIAWQLPVAVSSIQAEKPLRIGTYRTDAATDACIANLWTIARLLQEDRKPPNTLVCPVSGQPYVSRSLPEGPVYFCPQPERHGLRSLQVSRRNPVPEVTK